MPTVSIIGASGYAGQETLDRVLRHPGLEIVALGSDSLAGELSSALDVRLNGSLPRFAPNAEAAAARADLLFLCLDHDRAAAFAPPGGTVVVDLSGAHRLQDTSLYREWYGWEHPAGNTDWSYAIPELLPPAGELIANPGCYATAAILALWPVKDAIEPASVVVDAKSGVSGAGRSATDKTHFVSVDENVTPYGVGTHRHAPEVDQELAVLGADVVTAFTPHLLPLDQGELVSCYVTVDGDPGDVRALYEDFYAGEPFVEIAARPPGVRDVRETNMCRIHVVADERTGKVFAFGAIDNLWKGTSSQAIQSLNLMFGRDETEGLL